MGTSGAQFVAQALGALFSVRTVKVSAIRYASGDRPAPRPSRIGECNGLLTTVVADRAFAIEAMGRQTQLHVVPKTWVVGEIA
jgi:hypothetical protein